MTENKGFALNEFYSKIFKRYDLINRIFTLGMDQSWRKTTVKKCLSVENQKILDLCCGTGDLTIELARNSQQSVAITGYDFNSKMLEIAKLKAAKKNIENLKFMQGDAAEMPFEDESFNSITVGFGFRNLTFDNPNKDKHIAETFRVLKKGGRFLILESAVPKNAFIRLFYKIYLYLFLIPIGGLLSGNPKAYWYLAHSSAGFYSVEEIQQMLHEKGFTGFESQNFFFGAANLIIAQK
ncbi:MAG: bifunctional demethylmenaquinone methyltransferase/2-methoxy-6-polyprenyl-1,4-benzoquinol methylase UbiE [Bacteroidales bacterium]|nr:bifunctional demethylmenaquinone methyltransferase/2-methoxy-6-polyprenyl-1,4-benzoquinol methylase UbiE [Bacteroidales bacterium]MBN2821158.1 bifunctional demethylmenaquinone methyltransferase/2-methoxy-6-polyprenyl-1,4-benzoquinol methylase UbiE [Bacteroidales bacterium]